MEQLLILMAKKLPESKEKTFKKKNRQNKIQTDWYTRAANDMSGLKL